MRPTARKRPPPYDTPREFTITIRDEEFFPIVKRELEWSRDHIIEAGADYCKSKRQRDALVKAFNLIIGQYTSC